MICNIEFCNFLIDKIHKYWQIKTSVDNACVAVVFLSPGDARYFFGKMTEH